MSTIVVKIGGRAAENRESLGALCDELLIISREHSYWFTAEAPK